MNKIEEKEQSQQIIEIGILIISDSIFQGINQDKTTSEIINVFSQNIISNIKYSFLKKVIPDEIEKIKESLQEWKNKKISLILTSGGTGFSPRDVTPEATAQIIEKNAPAFVTAMFLQSWLHTPYALLSRGIAGIAGESLIINLPGNPKAINEILPSLLPAFPHAIRLLKNDTNRQPSFHQYTNSNISSHMKPSESYLIEQSIKNSSHDCCNHSMNKGKKSPWPLIPVSRALEIILENCQFLPTIQVPLSKSLGYIVAEDIKSPHNLPPFRASIKDGYAVRSKDGPGIYPVISVITAGNLPSNLNPLNEFSLPSGKVARITTGSPLPINADAVVMVENVELINSNDGQEMIKIFEPIKPGQDVREIGSDISKGQVILNKGERIGPTEIGLLASVGITVIPVFSIPKIAILSTGNELIESNQQIEGEDENKNPPIGYIRDSNRPMLISAIKEYDSSWHEIVIDMGIAKDDFNYLKNKVLDALNQADILISTGGVSMGELDLLQPVLKSIGTIHFGRILMKPSKPTTFATVEINQRKKLVFGLPGNPVSGIVAFHMFVVPAIRKISGYKTDQIHLTKVNAKLAQSLPLDPERPEFHRCNLSWVIENDNQQGYFVATSTGSQQSSRLLSMKSANALLMLPQGSGILEKGKIVTALIIGKI